MDIVGIWLLFLYGAIGGKWIDKPVEFRFGSNPPGDLKARVRQRDENERRARRRSNWGLGLATTGFFLQGVAQWLPILVPMFAKWL